MNKYYYNVDREEVMTIEEIEEARLEYLAEGDTFNTECLENFVVACMVYNNGSLMTIDNAIKWHESLLEDGYEVEGLIEVLKQYR